MPSGRSATVEVMLHAPWLLVVPVPMVVVTPLMSGREGDPRVCFGLRRPRGEGGDDGAGEGRLNDVGDVGVAGGQTAVAGRVDLAGDG